MKKKKIAKKIVKKDMLTPGDTVDMMGTPLPVKQNPHPMVPMSPAMVSSIKQSPKGKIPSGLARYLANKKKAKTSGYNFAATENKLGVVH